MYTVGIRNSQFVYIACQEKLNLLPVVLQRIFLVFYCLVIEKGGVLLRFGSVFSREYFSDISLFGQNGIRTNQCSAGVIHTDMHWDGSVSEGCVVSNVHYMV
jgi:hypothetical protein